MSFLKRFQVSLESSYTLPKNASYVVAYSGGVDSHVLLYCCNQLGFPVRAVHVHHGLQDVADDWVGQCQRFCKSLNVSLDVLYVDAQKKQGQSPEETARNVRYEALQKNLTVDDCLLTAQHLNDQAETLLLQLFRTASAAGLSAMPACRKLGENTHLRPLLSFSRAEIESYATDNDLRWAEDPSNYDVSFDRNFIRKNVVPLLETRWPEIVKQLSTVAGLQSNNLHVLEDMAAIDLSNAVTTERSHLQVRVYEVVSMLSIDALKQLTSPRLLNMLRYWIIATVKNQPTRNLLEEIEKTLINVQSDANPEIIFSAHAFKKFRGSLYLLKIEKELTVEDEQCWNLSEPLMLQKLNIKLSVADTDGDGLTKELLKEPLTVRFRKGGETFHPSGRGHSQRLKKLLQEAGVPPWERDFIPLVYFKDELIAVVGLWVCKRYSVGDGGNGWVIGVERF
ncbi:MAG: tRNA lysidine(34) synthetase TilS [Gammaproteobacteria bacterium]|nr:tRNA lysidine(34) synthetase TilS [Gammaproteobacteria bacterium]